MPLALAEPDLTRPFHTQASFLNEGTGNHRIHMKMLIAAMKSGNMKDIDQLIGTPYSPLSPYMRNKNGESLVHLAVQHESPMDVIELLIYDLDLSLELCDHMGRNAIHTAIEWSVTPAYFKQLTDRFVSCWTEGDLPLAYTQTTMSGQDVGQLALARKEHELLTILIDADWHDQANRGHRFGSSLLHAAVEADDILAVKLLTDYKKHRWLVGNIRDRDEHGKTPPFLVKSMGVFEHLLDIVDWAEVDAVKGGTVVEHLLSEASVICNYRVPSEKHRFMFITDMLRRILRSGKYNWGIARALKLTHLAPRHKAILRWHRLRLTVRRITLSLFSLETPLHELRYAVNLLRLQRPSTYSMGADTEKLVLRRLLRLNLLPSIDWESEKLRCTETLMGLTGLYLIPRELVFLVRVKDTTEKVFAFDLREVVYTKKNPYTKCFFSESVRKIMEIRFKQVCALRHSLMEVDEVDNGQVLADRIQENEKLAYPHRDKRPPEQFRAQYAEGEAHQRATGAASRAPPPPAPTPQGPTHRRSSGRGGRHPGFPRFDNPLGQEQVSPFLDQLENVFRSQMRDNIPSSVLDALNGDNVSDVSSVSSVSSVSDIVSSDEEESAWGSDDDDMEF